jgi:hypothetical protein
MRCACTWRHDRARRGNTRVARHRSRRQAVDGVYWLDEGALWDDFFHCSGRHRSRGSAARRPRVHWTLLAEGPFPSSAAPAGCTRWLRTSAARFQTQPVRRYSRRPLWPPPWSLSASSIRCPPYRILSASTLLYLNTRNNHNYSIEIIFDSVRCISYPPSF